MINSSPPYRTTTPSSPMRLVSRSAKVHNISFFEGKYFLVTDAIVDDNFEEAQKLGEEIKKRGFSIEITEKNITLTKK